MKKIFSILFALVLVVSLGLAIGTSVAADPGTTYYVSTNTGSDDTGDGSYSNPWKTIQHAVGQVASGDTIMAAAGAYDAFTVADKANINIISTEGATVTTANTACNYSLGLELPVCVWVMAMVENSTNINIEGIDFDGTLIIDKEAVIGILYLNSTGRIADLTVENIIGTELGAGVAIIDEVGASTVEITGSTISDNGIGILFISESIQEAHLTNIVGNTDYGVRNDGNEDVDATHNWWGDASGPYHESLNHDGMGDEVSNGVDFEPWLGSESVTQTVENATLNAIEIADIQVVVNGTATVTVAKYDSNPHPSSGGGAPLSLGLSNSHPPSVGGVPISLDLLADEEWVEMEDTFRDVCVINYTSGTEIELRLYYTDAEVAAAGVDEESLRLFWWNDMDWVQCSLPPGDSDVNMTDITIGSHDYSGYMWAILTEDTTPSLGDLKGDEFGGYGHPTIPGGGFCFIATAAYGTDTAEQLDILREFRDEVLLPNSLGARLVSLYYRTSPPLANFISQQEILRTAVRVGFIDPIVKILTWTHDLWST